MNPRTLVCAAALAFAAANPAAGQIEMNSDEPIDVQGDAGETLDNVMTLTGNVSVVQGESMLRSDKLIARLSDENTFETIEVAGSVRYWNGKEAIASDSAFYDAGARTITFTNNVVITQGETVITGGNLVYWLDTGRIKLDAANGGRVRGIFHTKAGSRPQL
ncbi:MAG: LPS export ABC transporter periplasmic protein LptC [Parvularculaceae bacterium]|jgi:lipopolysaccharide export system protein LptA|nr:LPS export ABC transporter periplasmic protein LptC [Parvularculaceae bacterium]